MNCLTYNTITQRGDNTDRRLIILQIKIQAKLQDQHIFAVHRRITLYTKCHCDVTVMSSDPLRDSYLRIPIGSWDTVYNIPSLDDMINIYHRTGYLVQSDMSQSNTRCHKCPDKELLITSHVINYCHKDT